MSELEDRINSVLSDPAQMEKISGLAKTLMGGGETPKTSAEDNDLFDPALLGRISRLMSAGDGKTNDQRALLEAMKPYLSEKRRAKMDKALKITKLAHIARLAMGEMDGDGNV